jgi:hypothetical protein
MMKYEYVTFSDTATPVMLSEVGLLNGYKLRQIVHGGRKIDLTLNDYYYLPKKRAIVSYRGSKAKMLVVNDDGNFNFIEKFKDRRGHWNFKPNAEEVIRCAVSRFN